MLSEEYVQDSSDEESATSSKGNESASIVSRLKTNQVSQESQSDVESEEDSASENGRSGAQSDHERTSSTGPGIGSQDQKRMRSIQQDAVLPPTKKLKTSQNHPLRIPSKTFKAPNGYLPVSFKTSGDASGLDGMFDNLDGKQIWHITAPATLPISSIKSFNIQSALKGEPILEHNGVKYHMRRDQELNEAVLRPSNKNNDYVACSKPVSRSFCLVESELLNDDKHDSAADDQEVNLFVAHEVGTRPLPRKQPTGLLMRYQPYGAVATGSEQLESPETKGGTILDYESITNQNDDIVPSVPKARGKKTKNKQKELHDAMDVEDHAQEAILSGLSAAKSPSRQKSEKKKKHREKTVV